MSKSLSIKEISKLAGVSTATVSRVIHQNGRFSAETEKRVKEIIENQNYTPDIIAQSMRTKVMPIVGVIVTDILDERAALFARAAQDPLIENGYQMVIFNTKRDPAATVRFIQLMQAQHVAGFIYLAECNIDISVFGDTPVVFGWEEPAKKPSGPYAMIRFDYRNAGQLATEHLLEQGCGHVAILQGNMEFTSQIELLNGYRDVLQKHNQIINPGLIYNLNFLRTAKSIEMLYEMFHNESMPFDGILCCSYRLVVVALSVFRQLNLKLPEDIKLVGFSGMRISRYGLMKYTAVTEDEEYLGRRAVQILLGLIDNRQSIPEPMIVPVQLELGFSS